AARTRTLAPPPGRGCASFRAWARDFHRRGFARGVRLLISLPPLSFPRRRALSPLSRRGVLRSVLPRARSLVHTPRLLRELVLVLTHDVLDTPVSGILEELHRALANTTDEEELLLVRKGLRLTGGRVDALLAERLHRTLGGFANLGRVVSPHALNTA